MKVCVLGLWHLGSVISACIVSKGHEIDSLRRSLSVELFEWLIKQHTKIKVYDPVVKKLPKNWGGKIKKNNNPLDSIKNSDVLIVGTFWPEFKKFTNKIQRITKKN